MERIIAAWESVPNEVIKKSFEVCAIYLPIDGTEDAKIQCFKKDGPLKDGLEEFQTGAAAFAHSLKNSLKVDEEDPFADILEPESM